MTTAAAAPRSLPLPPGPAGDPLLGSLNEVRKDSLAFFLKVAREWGDVVRMRMGPQAVVLVRSPEGIKHILQDNARNYTKQTRGFDMVRLLLGQGLLTSEGSFWLRQRRLAQPAFHRQRIQALGGVMVRAAEEHAAAWEQLAGTGREVDVAREMMRLTLRIASETLFGSDVSQDAGEIGKALTVALRFANGRITQPLALPLFVPTPENRRAKAAMETLDRVVRSIVERRRREGGTRDDLLTLLMEAKDEDTGERMSDEQLRDEVMTLLLAGHETTANALSWTFLLLSRHPEVRRRLDEELRQVLGGRTPAFEDVPKLTYTRMILDESMRLYPPAWIFSRAPTETDEVCGYRIEAGTFVMMSAWVTHRDPTLWENPEGFDPERFRPERVAQQPRYAYFPFGGGPRQCIGNSFALAEMTLVLATLAQRFRPDLVPGYPVVPEATITLRPRDGLRMTIARAR